jgi:C7-cyclitol 7-kinase
MSAILFDLGGTHLSCATSCDNGTLANYCKSRIRISLDGHEARGVWDDILSEMTAYIESVTGWIDRRSPVFLAFPGPIDAHQRIMNAPTVTGSQFAIPDLRTELMNLTARDVYILNDVSAAAWYFAERLKIGRFMVITVSSGIGSKICDQGHPEGVLDRLPYAGEIGHLIVDENPDAPRCDCGGIGHLGAIASGRGIERRAVRCAQRDIPSFERSACVRDFDASPTSLTNEQHLVPAAKARDEWALRVIRESTRPLARVLNCMVLGMGLDRIMIIGGFALSLGSVYLDLVCELMEECCDYPVLSSYIPGLVRLGDVNDEACLKGAAVYGRRITQRTQ